MAAMEAMAVVEEEEDEEEEEHGAGERQFVWDAEKGCLVDAKKSVQQGDEGKDAPLSEANQAAPKQAVIEEGIAAGDVADKKSLGDDGEAEDSDDSDADGGEAGGAGAESESRAAFLDDASTPELIKQALAVGGALAESVRDKWVLDKATQLSFRYDVPTQKMYCWNKDQGYMYLWKGRGKLEFLWNSCPGGGAPAGGAAAEAPSAMAAPPTEAEPAALWVTVIPPSVLDAAGHACLGATITEEVEVPSRSLGHVIGKNNASLKELETHSGATVTIRARGEEESAAHVVLEGTRDQVAAAKLALEQKLVMALGEKKVEKLQKHQNSELLEKKRTETGAEAAVGGVDGFVAFAEKWKLKAVLVRKLKKLDAMLQRYFIRHFKPWKAKPENALRSYVTTLMMHPQRWRLEALHEDGELEGEVCETAVVSRERGALIGLQRTAAQEILGEDEAPLLDSEQFIELEIDNAFGGQANRVFGDVQPEHCRLLSLGGAFYVMALESRIGTVVDGKKYRQEDGPVPIRDGSTLAVGKYVVYCEVGTQTMLQDRRRRILAGESFWKIMKGKADDRGDGKPKPDAGVASAGVAAAAEAEMPANGSAATTEPVAGEVANVLQAIGDDAEEEDEDDEGEEEDDGDDGKGGPHGVADAANGVSGGAVGLEIAGSVAGPLAELGGADTEALPAGIFHVPETSKRKRKIGDSSADEREGEPPTTGDAKQRRTDAIGVAEASFDPACADAGSC